MFGHARAMKIVILTLIGAAILGAVVGIAPALKGSATPPAYSDIITGCRVTDGDTIRCGDERIRLLGIDAPELPGHCRTGRDCAPGDPFASTDNLREAMTGELHIDRVGEDRYGRTLAMVTGAKGDLSCWQLKQGQAVYKPKWDNGGRVATVCPTATQD